MKIKFFWVPARDSSAAEAELNAFLGRSRVVVQSSPGLQPVSTTAQFHRVIAYPMIVDADGLFTI